MTNQAKIDELHERVTAWNDKFIANGGDLSTLGEDEEFSVLLKELMNLDLDTLFVLIGRSLEGNGHMPSWLDMGQTDNE